MERRKELLGMWISLNEGGNFWPGVMSELKNRSIQDILIASVEGWSAFLKPKPAVASKPSDSPVGGGPRLAKFETYTRAGIVGGSAKTASDDGDMRSRPVAKKRMLNIVPGGTPKLR